MADILISKFTTQIPRVGATPATPGFAESEGQDPVAPSGTPQVYTPVTIGSPANGLAINPTTQELSLGLASTSATGALSSTDWNTFNGKIGGTIASGQVAFGTGVNTVGGSIKILYEDLLSNSFLSLYRNDISGGTRARFYTIGDPTAFELGLQGTISDFVIRYGGSIFYRLTTTGNTMIGSSSAPTNTLDVNGTARIRTISNLGSAATSVLVPSATGVVSLRTLAELASDGLGSKWTDVTGGIFRNGAVAVGRTTIPTNATFAVQSLIASGGALRKYLQFIGFDGTTEHLSVDNNGSFRVSDQKTIFGGSTINLASQGHTFKGSGNNGVGEVFVIQNALDAKLFGVWSASGVNGRVDVYGSSFNVGSPTTGLASGGVTFKSSQSNGTTSVFNILNNSDVILLSIFSNTSNPNGFQIISPFLRVGNPSSVLSTSGATFKGNASNSNSVFTVLNSSDSILFQINGLGDLSLIDGRGIILGTTTGTRIGTATNQKIGFWNATPIVQPTTAVASGTLVSNGGTTLTSTDTIDGYTLQQVVRALRNTGLLA